MPKKKKKLSDEPNFMCCAAGKLILPDNEEPPQPIKSLLTGVRSLSAHFLSIYVGIIHYVR